MAEQPNFVFKIEVITPDQWKDYQEFRLKSLQDDPSAFGASYEESVLHTEAQIRQKLSNPNRRDYVAKIGDRIVAMANYVLETSMHVRHLAKIHGVFTDPEFRGRGVGFNLLKKILDDLHQNSVTAKVVLGVNNENEAPKNLYKKLGFVQFGLGKKEMKVNGKYYDQAQMELIFEDKL